DPVLKEQAKKDPAAVVPVVIERSSDTAAVAAVQTKGGKTGRQLKVRKGLAAEVPAGAVDALAREPGVLRVAFDAPVASQGAPDWDDRPLETVYPAAVGAPALWAAGVQGTGVGV